MVQKEVKKIVKEKFLLDILTSIKSGENPTSISKKLNIKKQNLNYYLRELKNKGLIQKIGYGVWEVKESTKVTNEVRGHAFMWKVRIPRNLLNWNNRINILKDNGFNVKEIGIKKIPRIIINDRKVWLGNKYIIIYEPESFFGETAKESRQLAVFQLKNILENLESKLKINLKENNKYYFKVRRSHYSLIKNNLAIQCNKNKEKIYVYDVEGLWFCIDNSYNLDEAETLNKNACNNNLGMQEYFNSLKRTNFKVTPEFILDNFNKIAQIQLKEANKWGEYAKHIESHTKAIKELSKGIKRLTKLVYSTKQENYKLKNKGQTNLWDF